MELICILFNPILILTSITSRKKISPAAAKLLTEKVFFLNDAVSGKSVWPHTYRLTKI